MNHQAALAKKVRVFQARIAMAEALVRFLKKHPAVASRTLVWALSKKPALYFLERAFIRPVIVKGQNRVALRLEKYFEDWEEYAGLIEEKTVCADISRLSRKELDKVLKQVNIDLRKTADEEEDDD
jgi:hypothetical protein